jgi:hypothetical protein
MTAICAAGAWQPESATQERQMSKIHYVRGDDGADETSLSSN